MKIYRVVIIVTLFICFFYSMSQAYIWEGFERENLWLITSGDYNAVNTLNISSERSTEGEHSLEVDISKTTYSKKGFISREGQFDLSNIEEIQFDILCEKHIFFSLGLSCGPRSEWYESKSFQLKKGWNRNISINFKNKEWKSQASFWEYTVTPKDIHDVRKFALVFINGKKGKLYIDNIRFIGKQAVNPAYTMPYEPLDKTKATNVYYLLKKLNTVPFAKLNSGKVIKEKNGKFSLPFKKVDAIRKAAYMIGKDLDWNDVSKLLLKINNPTKLFLPFAIGFQVGNGMTWFETPQFLLKKDRTSEIIINLNAPYFKSEATDWKYITHLYDKDRIKAINFLIYGVRGKESTGQITIEEFNLVKGKPFLPKREIQAPQYLEKPDKKDYTKPKVTKVLDFPKELEAFDKFEISFYLKNKYVNPYNPEEIYCEGIFTGPDKKTYKVPAFFYNEVGPPESKKQLFKVRFAPFIDGQWKFKIKVKNLQGQTLYKNKNLKFKCTKSERLRKGFVKVDNNHFILTDGSVFYPFGLSLGWVVPEDKNSYLGYLNKFAKSGMNWTRMWNIPWGLTLEWLKPKRGGLGQYSQEDADQWDKIIEFASENGIYIQFCINNYRDLAKGYNWENNPYCYINGGPIQEPEDFFTDKIARKYFRRKLLYIVARWGYATSIMAWELFNEVDLTTNFDDGKVARWHEEMADYLKSIDAFQHIITTSFSRRTGGKETFELEEMDFSQTHVYTEDFRQALFTIPQVKIKEFDKPHVMGEIGGSIETGTEEARDEQGVRIHNVIWYSFLAAEPSSALYWWWDEYIERNDLYYHFGHYSDLTKDVDWNELKKIKVNIITPNRGDYFFAPVLDWEGATGEKYEMKDNDLKGNGLLSKYLQGKYQKKWQVEPTFKINFPIQSKFLINVEVASYVGASFSVFLDSQKVFSQNYPAIESTSGNLIDKVYEVKIPAGEHTVKVVPDGDDWIKIKWFRFKNCVPDVEAYGVKSGDRIYVWIRNRHFDIDRVLDNGDIPSSKVGKIEIKNLLDSDNLKAVIYNTWDGDSIDSAPPVVTKEKVILEYPQIAKDILIIFQKE
ncbi:MAG: DUF5060 domain-containing protein [Spirochaetes bacterium]|nr:DUF5060 domain-containing protein [Spirochaetota bacterium]